MREHDAIDRYVGAAARGHEAARLDALEELRRGSAARVAAGLLPWIVDADASVARAAGEAAEVIVREAPTRSLWAVDRELRGSSSALLHGVPPRQVAALAAGSGGLGALALLSMQRNGYTRQAAVSWLGPIVDPLVLRLLLLRLNDVVSNVTDAAMDAVRGWLDVRKASALVAALPLLDTMTNTVRAARSGIAERARQVLALSNPGAARALLAAAREASDEDVRRLAILRLVDGSTEQAIEAVRLGLADRSPRVRLATGRWLGGARRPIAVRAAVVPLMEANPSPTLRLLALRLRRGDASEAAHQAVLARCLDGNAVVRFEARCQMRERGDGVDFRALALERLAEGSERDELVGALAVLSDIGRREDIETVRRFLEHPVRRVAAEAERTLGILELG